MVNLATSILSQVELAWITRCPISSKTIVYGGNEFLAEFNYSITVKPLISSNPQANSILERVHQTLGNIIRTIKEEDLVRDDENSWDGILAPIMFALCASVYTTTQHVPAELIFGRDSILNTTHKTNWQIIKTH